MLKFMRKRASSWAIKFVFFLIIFVFVLWGVGTMREKEQSMVGEVGKEKISMNDYQETYDIVNEAYRSVLGDKFDVKLLGDKVKKDAWDMVVERTLLQKKADGLGIKVSEDEIIEEIQKQEAFKANGQFSRERYLEALRFMKTSPSLYEKKVGRSLLMRKTMDVIKNSVNLSEVEAAEFFRVKNRSLKAGYITFDSAGFTKETTVTEEEEKKYYEENKDSFKKPESTAVSYIFVPTEAFKAAVKVEEKDLKEYYEEHKAEFLSPRTITLRHLFAPFGSDKEAARKKITDASALLAKEDFAKVAAKVNEDGTRKTGGLIGAVTPGRVSPRVASAITGLVKGSTTGVVESEYGFHVFRADDVKNEKQQELAEVKDEVTSRVKERKAMLYAIKKAGELKTALETGKASGETEYKPAKATIEKNRPVLADLSVPPDVFKTIFAAAENSSFGPVQLPKGTLVGKVEKQEKGSYGFGEIRDKIRPLIVKKKALELAAKKAGEAIKNRSGFKGETTDWFTPVTGAPKPLNSIKELNDDIVGLSAKTPVLNKVYKGDDKAYIVYFVDEQTKPWDPASDDAKRFKDEFVANKKTWYYQEWLKEEKKAVKIKVNEDLFKNL